jgi:hypothetical protein
MPTFKGALWRENIAHSEDREGLNKHSFDPEKRKRKVGGKEKRKI